MSTHIVSIDNKIYKIIETGKRKVCVSEDYNNIFDKDSGFYAVWGKTKEEDPKYSPIGPDILDFEISSGKCSMSCEFCYKGNSITKEQKNTSFETFKAVFDKMGKQLNQIAFGICDIDGCPDFFKMMEYSRANGVIPNYTTSGVGLTNDLAKRTSELCGAVAVSVYKKNKNIGYDAIKMFTNEGMTQVNIHAFTSEESFDFLKEIMNDMVNDSRLSKMNAIVFLGIKPKGRAKGRFSPLSMNKFGELIDFCLKNNLKFGFDSCSAPRYEKWVKENANFNNEIKEKYLSMSMSCESFLSSAYINCEGFSFPCSFCEGEPGWEEGVNVLDKNSFLDVWYDERMVKWRNNLLSCEKNNCRKCMMFEEINI